MGIMHSENVYFGGLYPSVRVFMKSTIWSSSRSDKPRRPTVVLRFWETSGAGQHETFWPASAGVRQSPRVSRVL